MFDLINGKVEIDPDLMAYHQFRTIWERDKTADKIEAYAFLSYIFHYYNPKSSYYKGYPESVRGTKIIEEQFPDHMKGAEFYDDKDFIQASNLYKESLQLSTLRGVLDFGKQTLYDLQRTLTSQKTQPGTKLNNLRKINEVIEEMSRTEKLIDEDEKDRRVKGKRELKDRERA